MNIQQTLEFIQSHHPNQIVVAEMGFGDEGGYNYQEFKLLVFDDINEFYQYFGKITGYDGWTLGDDHDSCYTKCEAVVSLSPDHINELTLAVYTWKCCGFYFTFGNSDTFNEVFDYIRQNQTVEVEEVETTEEIPEVETETQNETIDETTKLPENIFPDIKMFIQPNYPPGPPEEIQKDPACWNRTLLLPFKSKFI